ncbi:interferon alpha-inducible protein 27-like protein 2A [Xyrauchen texanus]|uniref:interferon alpha-inducible protein 27-like protein 2A n=1 Tax=Xyrauchen texanus TaxID=154827 RepID=UPI002241BA55|nr:interferon alpha-inducible protein 27-like protein 2A [Xyrauchen texanus]
MDPCTIIAAGAGAVAAVAAAPAVIAAAGFTGAGIAAGSLAASMMSSAAVASGGGVAAGSAVALLQSVGVAGIPLVANAAIGAIGATVGAIVGGPLICSSEVTAACSALL